MKGKNYILVLFVFHYFVYIIKNIAVSSCPAGFVALLHGADGYCAKCDTTCKTCSNEGMNNCIQCPTDFTYNQNTSYCIPPNSKEINTIESSYKFIGFSAVSGWVGGVAYQDPTYGTTVYRAATGSTEIYKSFALDPAHYKVRVLVSLWILDGAATASDWVRVSLYFSGTGTPINQSLPALPVVAGGNNITGLNPAFIGYYQTYPTGWRVKNIDESIDNWNHDNVQISFTSSRANFAIREFILIQYICNKTACSRCTDATNTSCKACTADPIRTIPTTYLGQCLCNSDNGYFRHPDWDYCVNPCPNRLDGQYYGDPDTKNCVLTCTNSAHYTDPATGQCSPTCSATITLGSVARPLYYDTRNKRCVTICPSTEPYFNAADRKCYSTCPGGKFKNDQNMECVTNCPDTGIVPLFGQGDKCVQQCVGADNWADFLTHRCTATCSTDNLNRKYFQDNSTGRNLCVRVCPFPQRFGDYITNTSQPYCDEVCPAGYYGDYLSPRHCVLTCTQDTANSVNYYGLKVDARECVKVCPQGSWGEKTNFTCVQTPAECVLDSSKYADNITWTCVTKGTCSKGRYSDDVSSSCVINCPTGTYADDSTKHCETGCSGTYFADPGINKCVQVCQTQDLYADVDSGNKCVSICNQTGSTPFRDPTTKKCVNICPLDKKLFADTTAKSCVYNCTPGTYAYENAPTDTNKTCVDICPGLFFADNSTGYGVCVLRCPEDPILFGDVVAGKRLCVAVCQTGMFGDQDPVGGRLCRNPCPSGWFAQNDALRRCVVRCNSTTYGYNLVCQPPANCPTNWVGDPSTNLCTSLCPVSQGTFSDFNSKLCVKQCPIISNVKYFADPTLRWCVTTCNASHSLFGNNKTLTCEPKCIDSDSFADAVHTNRFCNSECVDNTTAGGIVLFYRNTFTKTCVISTNCPADYFGDNSTDSCVGKCPVVSGVETWGHKATQTCVQKCYGSLWGDNSTGIRLCVSLCPKVPAKWSYDTDMLCMFVCPHPLYGQDFTRTCIQYCPNTTDPNIPYQTFAYDGPNNDTRRCLRNCPQGTFGDYTTGKCYFTPQECTFGWGDDFNNSCVHKCTGPTPWDSFGDNTTKLCTVFCSEGLFADSYTGTRECVPTCPGTYDKWGNVTGAYDTFGDQETNRCETYCMTPGYFADWQTHRCQARCSGDNNVNELPLPSYANAANKRCVIALACPVTPDKLYGDNRTRTCTQKCFMDGTTTEWADNLTRSCIPKCYHINNTNVYPYDTRFYGDKSTNIPMCIIKCPQTPRLFGNNDTNTCDALCPPSTWGDPNNNRSCVADCYEWNQVIHYSQDDQRLCVSYCKDGTFANWHNRHCETDPFNCVVGQYGSDANNSCVALCPQYMNYFGDPSTKLCVKTCPNLTEIVNGASVTVYTYADYSTRLCVRKCNETDGLHGTFGDNFTNTCVQRCPGGSFGDPLTVNRHCVATCTGGNFADPLSMQCVSRCPASPPYFGYEGNWTCLKACPTGFWADSTTRKCVDTCPSNHFRLTSFRRQCVNKCPSNPDLYADSDSKNCESVCTLGKFADPEDRTCKSNCLPKFQYNFRCVSLCPDGYYANSTGDCVIPSACDATVPYAENRTTKCVGTCTGGSFADPNSKYCIAVCPDGWYGDINICRQTCLTASTSASNITQTCVSSCPNLTYHEGGSCKAQCQTGYANDLLGTCHTSCPLTPIKLFANTLNHDCVQTCPTGYVRDHGTGFCVANANGCSAGKFSDPITGDCVGKCSLGYWGNKHNFSCITQCISGEYGYQSATERTCYLPLDVPQSGLYADPQSKTFIPVCHTTPKLYFADRNRKLCVETCQAYLGTQYYGDPQSRQCESSCTNATFYTIDRQKDKCVLKCTLGTFRFNNTGDPICQPICPEGFADLTTRVCVTQCPIHADTYGFYNTTSSERICVNVCPTGYYADPTARQCWTGCNSPLYADNTTHRCVDYCVDSFADDNSRRCMDKCWSNLYPSADNSTNICVFQCPSSPDYYNQNHVCVLYCQTPGYFADPSTRQCVSRCPNVTGATPYNSYGNELTGRCVKKCPQDYWGDNSTNLCRKGCPVGSFADNDTRMCVAQCPRNESIYADPFLHMCAYTCSGGYFGSQVNQQCIQTCDQGATQATKYWGDPLTTMCVNVCPSTTYSYGQNVTRTCISSCVPYTKYGFADNHSRICRNKCQNTTTPKTYADPTTSSCVQICPQGYFAQNTTNECVQVCITGYADNYSRYCVAKCPDDPQSYGDVNANGAKICVYECLGGKFSNNDTNLCDVKCPTVPDFFGDKHLGRCVHWCTEGTYAENGTRQCLDKCPEFSYADNRTRRCVQFCPNDTDGTYRDTTTQKCVRVCPDLWWAQNSSAICVNDCPKHANGTETYEDNISKFCVAKCPFPYFGKNDTHQCVLECSAARTLYGHHEGRVCVTRLDCFPVAGKIYYADEVSGTCVQVCPQNLWADDGTFTCVNDCDPVNVVNKLQYRNWNNQKCVSLCPSDPDEYADDSTGNCVRKCPPGSYAYATTGFRKCVASCQPYNLYADNSTNRCVSQCPTDPFMYADINTHKCVFQCSDYSFFADNKTQTCVSQCPASWELWGQRLTYTCVQLCPDGYFSDPLDNRQCNQQCTSPLFADKWTSSCVTHCSQIREYYYEDTSTGSGICVEECPGDSYGYNPTQVCKYKNADLTSSCPTVYFADRKSKMCVKQCPADTYADITTKYCETACIGIYYSDPATRTCTVPCSDNFFSLVVSATNHTCVEFCPAPYFAQNSTRSCVDHCAALYELQTTRSCETYCPEPYFKFDGAVFKDCRMNCTPLYADRTLRYCLGTCNSPQWGNPLTKTCDLFCPTGLFGRPRDRMCASSCDQGTFADPSTRLCLPVCPQAPLLYADDDINECVQKCENGFGYNDKNLDKRVCVPSCPNTTVTVNGTTLNLIYLADSSNHLCVLHCINELISFADYKNNQCTKRCPDGTFANNFTKQCVPTCPTVPNDTFAQNSSHICMQQCPIGTFGASENLYCVKDCWWPNFADETTQLCVEICPDGYFAQNQTAICVKQCSPNTYADPTTKRCVAQCPVVHQLFKYDEEWRCVSACPTGFYAQDITRKCKKLCAQPGMYSYELTRQCVRQCPVPYRGYDQNHTCILSCPYLYFYNITRNKCTKCPVECLVCTDPTSCLKCATGYNLFNGICDISCQPSNGIITYSDPAGICVRICPFGYYGDNATYSCTKTCPSKQYGSSESQVCEYCPETCAQCINPTNCTVCQSFATMAIDNMCYKDCNGTHKFYYNNTCFSTCPNGTYLTYTNVHCAACSANCLTCTSNATQCTSCKGKYFYNFTCLVQCPTNYFGNLDFVCQLCTNQTKAQCSVPLNFTTRVAVENYQYVIYLKFNQGVDINKQIQDILKVKLKVKRRLLDVTGLINNGISYRYEILADQTIKLYLIIEQTLDNPEFTVEITDPTAIVATNGGATLQVTQADFVIEKVEYYPPTQGKKATTNVAARLAVVFILVLYAISFFWTDATIKPIQLMQVALFHATVNVPIPPSILFYLAEFKRALFQFTPNFFSSFLDPQKSYHAGSQKIIDIFVDYNFLRHLGQIFFFLIVFAILWLVFFFLSNKRLITSKLWQGMFEDVFKRRFKYMALNDVFSLFYAPIIWFALCQIKDLTGDGSEHMKANAALTITYLIVTLIIPFIWLYMWCKFQPSRFQVECSFMCKRIKRLQLSYQIYSQEANDQKLQYSSQKMKEKFSQQQLQRTQVSSRNSKHQLQTFVTYMYLFLTTVWLVGLQNYVIPQLSLLIITNFIYIFYILYFRPYINVVNTVIQPLMICALILLESYLMYYYMNDSIMFSDQKTSMAKPLIIALSVFYMVMILWTIWRVIYDGMDLWNYFKKTEFYLVYGDVDHIVEKQQSEDYERFYKKAENIQHQVGDHIVEKIYKTVNQHGDSIIKVKKKVLKKKKKFEAGRKKKRENNYEDIQENSSEYSQTDSKKGNAQKDRNDSEVSEAFSNEYVRVNEPTAFELTKAIQKQKQQEKVKAPQGPIPKVTKSFKTIDDDIRDDQDDYEDDDYIIKSPKKTKKLTNEDENDFYNRKNNITKKVIVEIEDEDSSIHGIDDLVSQKDAKNELLGRKQEEKINVKNDIGDDFEFIEDDEQIHKKQVEINLIDRKKDTAPIKGIKQEELSEISMVKQITEENPREQQDHNTYRNLQQSNIVSQQQSQHQSQQPQNLLESQISSVNHETEPQHMIKEPEHKIIDLEELIKEEEENKNKKLMFLFDQDDEA